MFKEFYEEIQPRNDELGRKLRRYRKIIKVEINKVECESRVPVIVTVKGFHGIHHIESFKLANMKALGLLF